MASRETLRPRRAPARPPGRPRPLPGDSRRRSRPSRGCATQHRVPLVVRGAGTGYTGGAVPVHGGVVLSMERLNRILEIDEDNPLAVVQPNVITGELQDAVEARGLFYPPDPASLKQSSLGGNVAECAGGPRAVKYGTTRRYVLALEAVLPTGEIIRTGSKAVKNVVGYDLTQLLVGSEGTLAIVTEITLRLVPKPKATATLQATFADVSAAVRGVTALLDARVVPATIELIDSESLRAVEQSPGTRARAARHRRDADRRGRRRPRRGGGGARARRCGVSAMPARCRCGGPRARRNASACGRRAGALVRAARRRAAQDQPRRRRCRAARVPELFDLIGRLERELELLMPSFGHAGDGNIHVNLMVDPADADAMRRAKRAGSGAVRGRRGTRRVDQRRARHRLREGPVSVARAVAGGHRADAAGQSRLRSARDPQSRQDLGVAERPRRRQHRRANPGSNEVVVFDPATLLTFVIASGASIVAPGPAQALVLARTLSDGRRAGIVAALPERRHHRARAAAGVGASAVLARSALAFDTLKYASALSLLCRRACLASRHPARRGRRRLGAAGAGPRSGDEHHEPDDRAVLPRSCRSSWTRRAAWCWRSAWWWARCWP